MEITTAIIASFTIIVVVAIIMGSVVYCSRLDAQRDISLMEEMDLRLACVEKEMVSISDMLCSCIEDGNLR